MDQTIPRPRLLILFAITIVLAVRAAQQSSAVLAFQPAGVDYLPLWTAATLSIDQPQSIYDFATITQSQKWLIGDLWASRPFVYPPSFLLLLAPFALLPFWISYGAWLAATCGLYLWAVGRCLPRMRALALVLVVANPAFVIAVLVGQPSILIGALIVLGLSMLETRPLVAGVLIGLAASAKPTVLALAPLCLFVGGHYRALVGALIGGAAAGLAGLVVFGLEAWLQWIHALTAFQQLVNANPGLVRNMITPAGAAMQLGLDGPALLAARGLFAVAGAALAWQGFRTPRPLEVRLATLVTAGLFVTPYALQYDAVLLAPAAILLLTRSMTSGRWLHGLAALLLMICAATPFIGAYAVLGLTMLIIWGHRSERLQLRHA